MGCRALCVTLLALLAGSYAQPPCTLITPSVLRIESQETIVIDAQLQSAAFDAEILIQDFPQKKTIYSQTKVSLNSANGFLGKASLTIPAKDFEKDPEKKQFVYVIVKSPSCPLERAVLVSFHSGYIFIQTDKPLYTPGSSVLYRIFTTGHSMLPDSRTVDVEIHNPDGIVVHKIQFSSTDKSGIVSRSFPLPEIANVGTWRIISRFLVAPQKIFRTEFEVKEYVLPSFEVLLHADQNFFYVNDNEFSVEITARFLHGNPVEGSAYAIFGALIGNEKKSIPDSLTRLTVTNGKATATLKRTDIVRRFHDMNTLLGNYLYVTVTVTTNADTDKVEAEMSGIPVVKTRFKLDFSKTSKYFKPGLSYRLIASLLNPDGSPAPGVKVCLSDGSCSNTLKDGTAPFNINNVEDKPDMRFEVQTKADNVPEHRQATGSLTVQSYKPQSASGNYLHIAAQGSQVELGSTLTVHFYFKNANMDVQEQIKHVTYLILSRGKIVEVGREARLAGQVVVAKTLTIKEDFVPSFRIVAYYVATQSGNEIVSDSAWVDVTDSCIRKVEISQDKSKIQEPGTILNLRITGDPGANVGLVAVDRAVYVLSRKNRLSQSKVWKEVEQSDLGCSPGGGRNNEGVFTDAGLSIDTTTGLKNPTRTELRCPEARRRRKRSVILTGAQAEKVKQYQDGRLRQCCVDGMQKNLMKYSCARRATYVMDGGDCVAIFLECCKFVFEPVVVRGRKRPRIIYNKYHHRSSILLTGEAATEDDDEEYIEMKNILSRSIFSESWLWRVDTLPMSTDRDGYSSKSIPASLPDSITTWEFLAISMSPTSGICVAPSLNITVRKDFFIDLRLPYSVVRNEQVEIRVVLYSYVKQEVEVLVDLIYNKDMCSSSTRENNFRQVVKLDAEGSIVIPFVIVPLTIGELQVEVKALVRDIFYSDGVVKTLKVVPEGMRIVKTIQSIVLDPLRSENAEGVQRVIIDAVPLNDIVPNTEPETYVSVKGDLLGETLENSIDGSNLNHLIMVPSGCGEQNMMSMTPSVIATHYLDATGQWDKIGINRREEAIKTIQQGYGQQLVYRKSDNSYSAFTNRPSSTWLTAYVVKVFSMAFKLIYIERDVLCGAVKWLILNKQLPNGAFQEDAPVIHGEMVGGSGRTEPDASLTAFVLIALAESEEHCKAEVPNLTGSIAKSADYLEGRLKNLKKPYTVCIVSYALVLVGKLQDHSQLMKSSYGSTHWADASSDLYVIEATSYALLALLKLGRYHLAAPVVRWLTEQRFYGGGYGSTQATIMVFQALSAYQIEVPLMNDIKMDVSLSLPGRRETLTWRINQDNYMLRHSEKTSITGKISVSALGKGQGTLTVMSVYYAPMAEGAVSCKNFDFSVTLEDAPNEKKPDGVLKSMYLNICMRFQGITDSTMTIVDVSFLTGFKPDLEDLNTLTNRVERYISKFEMDTELSDRGSLIIYLDKVSRSEDECLKFKIHQHFEVGILQPAAVTIYEYYSLENRCTKFYHPTKEQGELKKICSGAECHCVAERCNLKNSHKGKLDYKSRVDAACEAGVDFVYECRLEEIDKSGAYDVYTMTVTKVIKLGSDEIKEASKRNFFSHRSCRDTLKLAKGRSYIIWGRSEDIWETKKEKSYVINGGSWIEEIPTNEDCAKTMSALCEEIFKFSDDLVLIGCPH